MGLFNTKFEAIVNHPQEEIFKKICKHVQEDSNLSMSSSTSYHSIFFSKGTSLFSYGIDFEIELEKQGERHTILKVKSSSDTIDFGKSKGMISDMLKEIYGENLNCVELEGSSYKSWRKIAIIISVVIVGIIILFQTSLNEDTSGRYNEYYESNTSSQEVSNTDVEPWMVGTWKGSSYVMDWNNNSVMLLVNLEIDKYGNATQYMQMQGGSLDVEQFTLKYDRSSEQLYYKDGGLKITIQVDSYNKKLSMPSSSGTLYLYKQ